jgi:hypothetical protein
MDLQLLEARWRTGRLLTSDLAAVAAELVAAGHDVPAAAQLAAGGGWDQAESRALFEQALAELGRGSMSVSQAALELAGRFADDLLAGELPPHLAARAISNLRWVGGPEVDEALAPFSRLHDGYENASPLGPLRRVSAVVLDRRTRAAARRLRAAP